MTMVSSVITTMSGFSCCKRQRNNSCNTQRKAPAWKMAKARKNRFMACDEAKRVARFDLHPGEVQAMHALAKRALFACQQVDLLLRDDLSLSVALNVSSHGLRLEVQTPLWHSQFVISKGNDLATLAVFIRRAINQEKTIPIRFENAGIQTASV